MHITAAIPGEETPLLAADGLAGLKGHSVYIYIVACLSAIGGFLFGYDTGIISGAMIYIRDEFKLDEWWQESIVSSTLLAAWLFSILAGSATDYFGRKAVIITSSAIFVAGSVLMGLAHSEIGLLVGRMVVGAGVGFASMTVPMYIAEVAPSAIRGQLVMINMCCITGGQFVATLIAYWFSFIEGGRGWRLMLGFGALPAAIQLVAFAAMPESPRWLIGRGRNVDAVRALTKLRPAGADIEAEFEAIKRNCDQARLERQRQQQESSGTFARIMASPGVRKSLLIGCLLQVVQQVSGINTVMYYSASIFEMSGVYSKQRALLMSAGTACVNFVFTLVGFGLVERAGRRKLTLISLFGVVCSLVVLGAGFHFAYYNSPRVSLVDTGHLNAQCAQYSHCSDCSRDPECGFCFDTRGVQAGALVAQASCLHVSEGHHDFSYPGSNCSDPKLNSTTLLPELDALNSGLVWAYEWCPSAYSWVTMLGMVMYLMCFAPGMGPMPWTINSEIYPSWARSWCLSASTSVCWLFNLFVSMTFLTLTRAITKHGAFYLYAALAAAGFVFFALALPETKGKSLEELEDMFAESSCSSASNSAKVTRTKAEDPQQS